MFSSPLCRSTGVKTCSCSSASVLPVAAGMGLCFRQHWAGVQGRSLIPIPCPWRMGTPTEPRTGHGVLGESLLLAGGSARWWQLRSTAVVAVLCSPEEPELKDPRH